MSRKTGGGPRFMPAGGRRSQPRSRDSGRNDGIAGANSAARGARVPSSRTGSTPGGPTALTLDIEALSDEGRGIARHEGKTVFVTDALPGERVQAAIRRRHQRYDEADLLEVEVSAPQRATPACGHYRECGGCNLQHLAYTDQLEHKQTLLRRLLKPWQETLHWAAPLSAAPWAYRYRARLLLADGAAGFRGRGSHQRVALLDCPVLAPPLAGCLPSLQSCLANWPGLRGELLLACDDRGQCAAQLDMQRGTRRAELALRQWATDAGMLWMESDPAGTAALQPPLQLELGGQQLRFGPADFIQSNQRLNPSMVDQVMEWLAVEAGVAVADWFCGLGNFTLPLANSGASLTGFDLDAGLLQRAAANAKRNRQVIAFVKADLIAGPIPALDGFDAGVLDPPRAGAAVLCTRLADLPAVSRCRNSSGSRGAGLRRLVYVSCDPQTLARDIAILARGGWQPRRAGIADMFPQTGHIETMVLLSRD